MLDYPLLEALNAVVREGSFERAAQVLHVTPSAVSQRVKLLEERTGTVLVVRGQPCRATETGALLCRHVDQVGTLEHELGERLPQPLRSATPQTRSTLRIAANADSVATWFVPVLGAFAQAHPVLFDVTLEDQDHTAALLRNGTVQAAVTTLEAPVQGCRSVRLGRMRFVATCSPSFHARHFAGGLTRTAFSSAPTLTFNAKDHLQRSFVRRLFRKEVEVPTHWLPTSNGFVEACLSGMGWAVNPEPLVRAHLDAGALVELAPRHALHMELFWQSWRLSSGTLDALTQAVTVAARKALER